MLQEERIDKWLWATRIFKTRSMATDACKKGRVMVDGVCIKPSRNIKIGDTISVRKPPVTYTFEVTGLTEARIGAKLVPQYLINKTTKDQYELLDMVKISGFVNRKKGWAGRQKKKDANWLTLPRKCHLPILIGILTMTMKTKMMRPNNLLSPQNK